MKILCIALALFTASFFIGCASTANTTASEPGAPTSSMPWNKPQSWEGSGQLGGAMGR
jgi:uncharacterized protein YceK